MYCMYTTRVPFTSTLLFAAPLHSPLMVAVALEALPLTLLQRALSKLFLGMLLAHGAQRGPAGLVTMLLTVVPRYLPPETTVASGADALAPGRYSP